MCSASRTALLTGCYPNRLGMHAIKERPIAENGQVVIAPMMYIALSYDHRIIDGKDAVQFLVDIKNQLENPHRMLLGL